VRQAASSNDEIARTALDTLCNAYWYPVYAYIRSRNHGDADAKDLTQGFFARLLRLNGLAKADPRHGRLRSYLLSSVKNFLISEHERAASRKRGGEVAITSFDDEWAGSAFANEPVDEMTPDRLYQRRWALTILEFAFELLREEYVANGKMEQYERLRPMLGFTAECELDYADVSAQTGVPVNTLKVHVHRLRQRWKEILREQVANTLAEPTEENIKDELRELLECV
jgi:RNA polymerase sigma-70 factor (ECF subfamily)